MPVTKEKFNKLSKQAADNLARKLKLEQPLTKKLNSFFDRLNKDFKEYYTTHGATIGLSEYQKELEKILNDHHIKVASDFSNNLREIIGYPSNDKTMQRKLDANIKGYAAQRSHLISHEIIDTTRSNIELSVRNAEISVAKESEYFTNEEIANVANENLNARLFNRTPIISTTETQSAAETGKLLEYQTMISMDSEIDGNKVGDFAQKKIWIAILDDDTREAHVEADGQEVDVDDPFVVDGEDLMAPSDDSMGASVGNIINCRCSMEFIID